MAKGSKNKESDQRNTKSNWVDKHEVAIMMTLMVASLIIIIVIAAPGLLLNITVQTNSITAQNTQTPNVNVNSFGNISTNVSSCLARYGISEGAMIYVYSETCSAAQMNTPWMETLQGEGYNIYFANTDNASAMAAIASCLSGVEISGTPEFICPINGNSEIGAFNSETDLNNFVASCK